jgi:hypothetical protein
MIESRQLHLFKGKRQRGTQLPPAVEFATCCLLADTIDRWIMPGWAWTHLPFGEHRDHKINPKTGKRFSPTGQRLKRMGTKRGWPDYIFAGPERALFWLEMKRAKKGHLSEDQDAIAAHLKLCGFDYLCASSYDEAVAALVARGILRRIKVQ